MRFFQACLSFFIILFLMTSCGNEPKVSDADYDRTKKMVVDILQTDEAKKTLQDIISDDKMKQHLIIDTDVVKESINETLVSEAGKKMWERLFSDPTFIETFNKSIAEDLQKTLKHLMNDAEFQKQMMEILQNPELMEQTLKLLKSQQFQEHIENTIITTLQNPVYQAKLQKSLKETNGKKDESSSKEGSNEDAQDESQS